MMHGHKGFTENLKILDATLDLAILVAPLQCVKMLLIEALLTYALLVRHSPTLQYYELLV